MAAEVSDNGKSRMEFLEVFSKKALQAFAGGDCIALQKVPPGVRLVVGPVGPLHE
jgi:hypothetical protein